MSRLLNTSNIISLITQTDTYPIHDTSQSNRLNETMPIERVNENRSLSCFKAISICALTNDGNRLFRSVASVKYFLRSLPIINRSSEVRHDVEPDRIR